MSDSRFGKAKTDGEIMPGTNQKLALRRTKTVERFFAGLQEEDESRQFASILRREPVEEDKRQLRCMIPKEALQARVQLLGDLLTGQKKQSEIEEPDVAASSAAAAAKM